MNDNEIGDLVADLEASGLHPLVIKSKKDLPGPGNKYTICYVGSCIHNDHNRCMQAIPAGKCDRRNKYHWGDK